MKMKLKDKFRYGFMIQKINREIGWIITGAAYGWMIMLNLLLASWLFHFGEAFNVVELYYIGIIASGFSYYLGRKKKFKSLFHVVGARNPGMYRSSNSPRFLLIDDPEGEKELNERGK